MIKIFIEKKRKIKISFKTNILVYVYCIVCQNFREDNIFKEGFKSIFCIEVCRISWLTESEFQFYKFHKIDIQTNFVGGLEY